MQPNEEQQLSQIRDRLKDLENTLWGHDKSNGMRGTQKEWIEYTRKHVKEFFIRFETLEKSLSHNATTEHVELLRKEVVSMFEKLQDRIQLEEQARKKLAADNFKYTVTTIIATASLLLQFIPRR